MTRAKHFEKLFKLFARKQRDQRACKLTCGQTRTSNTTSSSSRINRMWQSPFLPGLAVWGCRFWFAGAEMNYGDDRRVGKRAGQRDSEGWGVNQKMIFRAEREEEREYICCPAGSKHREMVVVQRWTSCPEARRRYGYTYSDSLLRATLVELRLVELQL